METTHTRMYKETLRMIRHICAETNEKMLDAFFRLVKAEYVKIMGVDTDDSGSKSG